MSCSTAGRVGASAKGRSGDRPRGHELAGLRRSIGRASPPSGTPGPSGPPTLLHRFLHRVLHRRDRRRPPWTCPRHRAATPSHGPVRPAGPPASERLAARPHASRPGSASRHARSGSRRRGRPAGGANSVQPRSPTRSRLVRRWWVTSPMAASHAMHPSTSMAASGGALNGDASTGARRRAGTRASPRPVRPSRRRSGERASMNRARRDRHQARAPSHAPGPS